MSQLTDAMPCILPAAQSVHDAWLAGSHERAFTRPTCEIGLKTTISRSFHSIASLPEECRRELATSC